MNRKPQIITTILVSFIGFIIFTFATVFYQQLKDEAIREDLILSYMEPANEETEPLTREEAEELVSSTEDFLKTVYYGALVFMVIDFALFSLVFIMRPGNVKAFGVTYVIAGFAHVIFLRFLSSILLVWLGYKMLNYSRNAPIRKIQENLADSYSQYDEFNE